MATLKKRSPIWQYFDLNSDDNKYATCMLCQVQISRGGEGKKAGTSAMSNHVKSKHPEEFELINKNKVVKILKPVTPGPTLTSTSASSTSENQSIKRKLFWNANDAKAKKYNYLIAEMIAIDNEPISILEKVGFKRLLEQAIPRYELPSHTHISQKIVPDIYNRIHNKIKINISNAIAVSVTSDVWTGLENGNSFLGFTAHWLSPEFQLQHGVLAMKPFSGSHTKENIAKELNATAARWDIEKNKIHLLIHNGASMVKQNRVAEYDSARCFIDSLQQVVNESMKAQAEVLDMIATGRLLVTHFNHSGLVQEKLDAIQKELNLPQHQLVQDINTRWNSTFYMAELLLEQKRAISLYIAENDDTITNLSIQQWSLMEQYKNLLKPFEEITKIISSGISCISEVIPHVSALKKYLDKNETAQRTPDLAHMRVSLKSELESCFKCLKENPIYLTATFLDPRFKSDYLGVLETEKARQKIMIECIKNSNDVTSFDSDRSPSSTPAKRIKEEETESNVTREAHDTFWDCFNEVAKDNSSECRDQKNPIANEIDLFLKTARIDRDHDPYIWWSVNSNQYPQLSTFARIYLSAPGSSVYSERLFSEAGLVYESKRSRLLPTNAEKMLFIHHNLPLVNFEY